MKNKLSLMALMMASAAMAQDAVDLPEISLNANFDEVEVKRTGAQLEVIEGEAIEENQTQSVAEFLGSLVGVSIGRSGPIGSNTNVLIRGTRQYETKVYVDGVDVTDPSLIQSYYNFANMTMGDVERIEVVKGSQSAIYGGNAVGGVIHITTKGAARDGLSGSANVEYGTYETMIGNLTLAHKGANHHIALTNSRVKSEGFSAAEEDNGNTEADGFESNRWSLKASYDISNNFTIGLSGFIANSEGEYDGYDFTISAPADADNLAITDERGGRVFALYKTDHMRHELSYSQYAVERQYEEAFANYTYEGARRNFTYAGDLELMETLSLNLRLEHSEENYKQSGDYGSVDLEAAMNSAALGVNYSPMDALDLNLALRYDDHEIFGGQSSYRLAAAYRLGDAVTFKASYGTGYRAPSLYEANYGATVNLKPETSRSFDFGVEYRNERGAIGANYFNIQTENLVQYGGTWPSDYYENVEGVSKRSGVELYGRYEVADFLNVNLGYTHITTEDANGNRLTNIPTSEFSIGASAKYAGFKLGVDAKMVRDVLDRYGVALDDYTLVNARIGYKLGDGELYLRGENLFDADYQTVRGYSTSGRAYYVGYRAEF